MPDPQPHADLHLLRRVAVVGIVGSLVITSLKISIFLYTDSAAVLSDALESVINILAAVILVYSIQLANRPPDHDHPYGHGKAESVTVGIEGWLILMAGLLIGYEAIQRLITGESPRNLDLGIWMLAGVNVLSAALAWYVLHQGRKHSNAALRADGRHLVTDFVSTLAVILGLLLVNVTGYAWLDPGVALCVTAFILFTSGRLLKEAADALMDRVDPADDAIIRDLLDAAVSEGLILSHHKVRHRHSGAFHWVDLHIHVPGRLSVAQGHRIASEVEHRIEQALHPCNVTAHVEPAEKQLPADGTPAAPASPAVEAP